MLRTFSDEDGQQVSNRMFQHVPSGACGNKQTRTSRDVDIEQIKVRDRRVSSPTTVCLFLVGLIVMSIGIMGGIYLYRCARKPVSLRKMENV